jgi:glycerol kinase
MNTGTKPCPNEEGLIVTLAAAERGRPREYALEGSVFVGGAVVQWVRDEMELIRHSEDSAYFAQKTTDNGGVYVVPAFVGLGAPYWNMRAKGIITGLTRGSGKNHIIRAALESVAYQTNDILNAMQNAVGTPMRMLKADGGASKNPFLMKFQADISDIRVQRFKDAEATALGAAFLAGLSTGMWKDRGELAQLARESDIIEPSMPDETRTQNLKGWKKAVRTAIYLSEIEAET